MSDRELQALAVEAGVLVEWEDASGQPQTVAAESLRAILAALGLPAGSLKEIAESRRRLAERARALRAFVTGDVGRPIDLGLQGPARLSLESGEVRDLMVEGASLSIDEAGYHRLEIGGREITLAIAPRRAFAVDDAAPGRRIWAPAVQVYALRGRTPQPFGDFGVLGEFAEVAAQRGADAVAISPVHALFAADAKRFGPYAPSTRLFLNVLYADPSAVFVEGLAPGASGGDLIEWREAIPERLAALRAFYERFRATADGRRGDFEAFRAAGGDDLEGHARFEALHGKFFEETGGGGWPAWPEPFRDARSPKVTAFARENAAEVEFHIFLQWLADRSLAAAQRRAKAAGMALGLITDIAVGMDAGGSHAWSRPQDLLPGVSIGAPPDFFQAEGQDWGIAAFSPHALMHSGYEAFLAVLRAAMRHAGGVRIDHVMGLRRLWLTPHGAGPTEGAYLTYPFEDLLRLIALESVRARAVVVGEDLGTVPDGFRDALDDRGVMGMRVLWFERTETGGFTPPESWSAEAAALTSTHDLPTLAGWWRGRDIDWQVKLGRKGEFESEAEARRGRAADRRKLWQACVAAGCASGSEPPESDAAPAVEAGLAFVASSPSKLAILPVEDLLGLEEQPNLPGTLDEHPNWRRRLPAEPEALFATPEGEARSVALNERRAS
ncbi:MAG: 4-alpha-glucanotransferase [Phenylobacterium sp.]|uniref:4-alpha-glucanotransferase n=1 Tax=Phenylobacterium sp. TaxID=1871053 RepID=UPI00391E031E